MKFWIKIVLILCIPSFGVAQKAINLKGTRWEFLSEDSCLVFNQFITDSIFISYDCEMPDTFFGSYNEIMDTVILIEYGTLDDYYKTDELIQKRKGTDRVELILQSSRLKGKQTNRIKMLLQGTKLKPISFEHRLNDGLWHLSNHKFTIEYTLVQTHIK